MSSPRLTTHAVVRLRKARWAVEVTYINTDSEMTAQHTQWSTVKRSTVTAKRVMKRLVEAVEFAGLEYPPVLYVGKNTFAADKDAQSFISDWDSLPHNFETGIILL